MGEQQLRQDKYGCYYLADVEPPEEVVIPPPGVGSFKLGSQLAPSSELAPPIPAVPITGPVAPAKRTRGPRKAAPAPAPTADSVTIPPPPPIIRG